MQRECKCSKCKTLLILKGGKKGKIKAKLKLFLAMQAEQKYICPKCGYEQKSQNIRRKAMFITLANSRRKNYTSQGILVGNSLENEQKGTSLHRKRKTNKRFQGHRVFGNNWLWIGIAP